MQKKGRKSAAGSGGGSWFACIQFFVIVGTFVFLAMVFIFLNFHAHGQVIVFITRTSYQCLAALHLTSCLNILTLDLLVVPSTVGIRASKHETLRHEPN